MNYPKLYKIDSNGSTREWWIEVDGNAYRSHAGVLDGAITTSGWKYSKAASQDTDEEQAIFDVESIYKKKREIGGFHEDVTKSGKMYFAPMLAQKYDANKFDWNQTVYCQAKFDGVRCVITSDGMFSRNGKPLLGAPHIFDEVKHLFDENPELVLDGEIYNHLFKDDFNKIISMIRKTKPTTDHLEESKKYAKLYVYDLPSSDKNFGDRCDEYNQLLGDFDYIVCAPTNKVKDVTQLNEYYAQYLEDGYEGQMVRLDKPYEQKRSKHLLKRKDFIDEEFTIRYIEDGKGTWAGKAKKVFCVDDNGVLFGAGIKGNFEFTQKLFENRKSLVGKQVTIQYFELTPTKEDGTGNVPRFGVATKFWEEEKI